MTSLTINKNIKFFCSASWQSKIKFKRSCLESGQDSCTYLNYFRNFLLTASCMLTLFFVFFPFTIFAIFYIQNISCFRRWRANPRILASRYLRTGMSWYAFIILYKKNECRLLLFLETIPFFPLCVCLELLPYNCFEICIVSSLFVFTC